MKLKDAWLIFFKPQELYWRARGGGYTSELLCAGLYTQKQAEGQARSRPDDEARKLTDELKKKREWLGSQLPESVGTVLGVWRARKTA